MEKLQCGEPVEIVADIRLAIRAGSQHTSHAICFFSVMDWHEQVRFRDFAKQRILRVFLLILPRSKCNGRPTAVPRRPTTSGEMKVLITFHLVYADFHMGQKENSIACTVVSILGGKRVLPCCIWPLTCWMLEFKKFKTISFLAASTNFVAVLSRCLLLDAFFWLEEGRRHFCWEMSYGRGRELEFCHGAKWFGWFRLVCRACRCQRDTRKMEEASHWARNRNCFLTLSPVFENVLWSVLKLLFFCHAHVHLGGFPLIQSLDSYHILSYQSYPVMSWTFLQLDSYGSLSIHRSFAVHEGTALSGDLLEARVKSPAVGIFERFFKSWWCDLHDTSTHHFLPNQQWDVLKRARERPQVIEVPRLNLRWERITHQLSSRIQFVNQLAKMFLNLFSSSFEVCLSIFVGFSRAAD